MNRNLILTLSACAFLSLTSCSKLGKLTADNFSVSPQPLEVVGGKVPATIEGQFPEKFMNKKATVTVIPELHYGNGQVARGEGTTFQGEKVMGNDRTISYRLGGRYTMKANFNYVPEMQKSDMYLAFNATIGNKKVEVPALKVGYGVIATAELYRRTIRQGGACLALDSFQRVLNKQQEANVKFLINQANLRSNELKNNSVKEFVAMLKRINADREGLAIKNVEVKAYASPDGGYAFNDKLANKRQNVSEGYVKQQLKGNKMQADIDAHYTAQDWEGFMKLVQASNIQDKDVILRVLSMYKDPQEREQQIRNMSEGFRELADGILPELRRSRLIINYQVIGRSDEQIKQQYAADPTKLSLEELLYLAALEDQVSTKEAIYKKTIQLHKNDFRAYNNLAALALNKGDEATAERYLSQALRCNSKAPEAFANKAYIDLTHGRVAQAEQNLANATEANGFNEILGALNIARGNYANATEELFNNNNSAALAQLLNKNYMAAEQTLNAIQQGDAMTSYLKAILYARQGKRDAAQQALQKALQQDATLRTYAENDLELANIR
ncbi:tetratricopeptide repeat protein [Segatella oulorum]|uniref:tetratricopeptide repeat protein n=1 Tax=Segatella oulorum TaxID=28136 RepID=UPI0023F31417|nr:tetratricopeptide repeat protein [Segatella oulorum]